MARFNLNDYETVESRLERFWQDYPDGAVRTSLCPSEKGEWVVFASVFKHRDHPQPDGTGYAHERIGDGMVNTTSALENCETSAIGRALANIGYAPKGARPSREEMAKVDRQSNRNSSAPVASSEPQQSPKPAAPDWWVDFQDACKQNEVSAQDLATILGEKPTLKSVTDWMQREEGTAAELLSLAMLGPVKGE